MITTEAARNAIMALRCNEAGDELADALKAWVLAEERVRIAERDLDPASPFVTTWMQARIEATDALGRIRRVGETAFLLAIAATDRQEADSHAE